MIWLVSFHCVPMSVYSHFSLSSDIILRQILFEDLRCMIYSRNPRSECSIDHSQSQQLRLILSSRINCRIFVTYHFIDWRMRKPEAFSKYSTQMRSILIRVLLQKYLIEIKHHRLNGWRMKGQEQERESDLIVVIDIDYFKCIWSRYLTYMNGLMPGNE